MDELTIRLLGSLEIAGGRFDRAPALSRKAKAVFAFLALQPGRPQSRDRLAALFWQNSPEKQGRTNLRQALAALRKRLGAVLVTEGDNVALDESALDVDAAQFEECLSKGDLTALEEAAVIYEGDLLEGFSIKEEAFEAWIAPAREYYRSRMIDGLIKMIGCYEHSQNFAQVLQVAPRLLALDPLNEEAHRAAMRAYAAQGRHNAALKQFELCRDLLCRDLGVQPQPETIRLAQDLREQRAKARTPPPAARSPDAEPPGCGQEEGAAARNELALPDRPSIAVLPFRDLSGDPDQAYFSDGITEDIITELSRFRSLFVIARNSSFAFHGAQVDLAEVRRLLGVQYVVEGSIRKANNRVRVTTQLIDAASGSHIWAEHYDRDLDDIFAVQDEVVSTVVATLAGQLEQAGRAQAKRKPPANLGAHDFFLRGRQHYYRWRAGDSLIAQEMFEQAIARDPEYAPAHAGLAETYVNAWISGWADDAGAFLAHGIAHAKESVALDEMDSRSHTALGMGRLFDRDFEAALYHLDRAVALNPNDTRALVNSARFFSFAGEPERAIPRLTEANRFDPFAKHAWYTGFINYTARNYSEAVRALTTLRDPAAVVRAWIAASHAQAGRTDEARAEAQRCAQAAQAEAAERGIAPIASWIGWAREREPYRRVADTENLIEGLQKAGLE
jgi:TolB-like protein/DNA-binding SARP family transcriptional activator